MRTALFLTVAACCLPPALAAQQPTDTTPQLTPIVVTATRLPSSAATLASAVTVLDGDALRRAGVTSVAEALRSVPTATLIQTGSYGGQTSLFVRGGENDYVRVLVDGVPLNQAGGAIDLSGLSTENVERIEIVRGPASVLYGSDAMTGVVQIITRRGTGAARVQAYARGGTYNSSELGAWAAGGGTQLGASAGIERTGTDGVYAFNNGFTNGTGRARLTWTPDARTDVGLTLRARTADFHYPTDGAGNLSDSNQHQLTRETTLALDAGRHLTSAAELRLLVGYQARRDSLDDAPDGPADTAGIYAFYNRSSTSRATADLWANVTVTSLGTITVGSAVEREREHSTSSYLADFGAGPPTTFDTSRTNAALYTQLARSAGRLGVQLGFRLDDNQRFGTFGTWRAGASLALRPGLRARLNAGTAFKEPTFAENFSGPYSAGNPELKPERSAILEAGLEQSLEGGRVVLSATAFGERFRDMIQYTLAVTPGQPNYYNVAGANVWGAELELRAALVQGLSLSAQYSWLHTEASDSGFDGTAFAQGQRLLRRPASTGSVGAEWRAAHWLIGSRALAVGSRDDLDFGTYPFVRVTLPAYGRLDVWGALTVVHSGAGTLALTLRADNVTGARYHEAYGFAAPGRRVLAGVKVDGGR